MMAMLSNTFPPFEDKLEDLKILLDVTGLGFAVAAAPIWNSGRFFLFVTQTI